jgi:hypothetical protein
LLFRSFDMMFLQIIYEGSSAFYCQARPSIKSHSDLIRAASPFRAIHISRYACCKDGCIASWFQQH